MVVNSSSISMGSTFNYSYKRTDTQSIQQTFGGFLSATTNSFSTESTLSGKSNNTMANGKASCTYLLDSTSATNATSSQKEEQTEVPSIESDLISKLLELFLANRRDLLKKLRSALGLGEDSQTTTWTQTESVSTTISEEQSMDFSATGTVMTNDGRAIEFDCSVSMSRSFFEQTNYTVTESGTMLTDPLVVWMDDCPDVIEPQTFSFDLDSNGQKEQIHNLSQGKGFLALDKNGDGVINDGSELFGTKSGDGFRDLSAYDEDGNGFIDEADSVYSQLKVWAKNKDGSDRLISLKDADVGAIYLGSSRTPFDLMKKGTNELEARIQSTGVFLHEDGTAGKIQQIDMAHAS